MSANSPRPTSDDRCCTCGGELDQFAENVADGFFCCWRCNPTVQAMQFGQGNSGHLTNGLKAKAENLPAPYQVRFEVATTDRAVLLERLEVMTLGALTLLEALEQCEHLDAGEMVGAYQQLVNRLIKIRGEMEGGKQRPTKFGNLTDERALKMQQDLAHALGYGLTKFSYTYTWLTENGLVTPNKKGFRRRVVKGLASMLAGSATTIETWSAIKQWEDHKNAKGSNAYIEAGRAKRR